MKYMTSGKKNLLMSVLLIACANASMFGCSMSPQSTQVKNQQLQSAEERLLQNPQDKQSLSVIINMLKDSNGVARSNAATTLGGLAEKIGASIKDEAVPALIDLLDSGDRFNKKASACALKEFGPLAKDAIPVLRKNLIPSSSDVAWCSAEALGSMDELAVEAVPDLLKVIKDDQSRFSLNRTSISEFAIKALGEIGPAAKEAVPDLESLLSHESPYFRIFVSVALIRIDPNNQKGLGALEALLKDKDVEVRRKTIWTLELAGVEAVPAKNLIKAARKDDDLSVRATASRLLDVMGDNR